MKTPEQSAKDLLDQIAVAAGKQVEVLILDMRDQINEAITACVEDAQDAAEKTEAGKRAVLTLPVSIKWDLDTRAVEVSLAVSIKRKATADIVLDDPAQPGLFDGDGDEVGGSVKDAVRKIGKAVRDAGTLSISMGDAVELREAVDNEIERRAREGGVA